MATSSSSNDHGGTCPLCGGRLAQDHVERGFVRHLDRPDEATADRILAGEEVTEADKEFLRNTGQCPFERRQRD